MTIKANELLHSRIIENCIPIFNDGHYQHVALESMKQVELALIDKGIAPKKYFGVRLVKWLMGGQNIPLVIPMEEFQEQACTFFRGAFGYYRNYAANDGAEIDKKTSFRIMILASELLDLVAASTRSFEGLGGIDGVIESGLFNSAEELINLLEFMNTQQFIECDYSEYKIELAVRGFSEAQEEAVFDFGFVKYAEWETGIDYEMGQFHSTLVGEVELTKEGVNLMEKLNKMVSSGNEINGG